MAESKVHGPPPTWEPSAGSRSPRRWQLPGKLPRGTGKKAFMFSRGTALARKGKAVRGGLAGADTERELLL